MAFGDHFFVGRTTRVGEWLETARTRAQLRQLNRFLPPKGRVLEIGPGKGRFAELCIAEGLDYHAVEGSPESCRLLRAKGVEATEAFVPPLPPSDVQYDAICAWAVLEHMTSADAAAKLVDSACDQLADRGVLAVMSPELKGWGLNFWACDHTHAFPTSAQTTMNLFHNAGLDVVGCSFMSGPFVGLARFLPLLANLFNPSGLVEKVLGPRLPPRKLRNLKMSLSECFLVIGRKKASG